MASHGKAFGVEPGYPPYRLRQARYHALAEDVADFAGQIHDRENRRVQLLDVGVGKGVSLRYLEVHAASACIDYHAADCYPCGLERVYKWRQWQHHRIDAEQGMPQLESEQFDVVICEQMLEHLHNPQAALTELARVLRPGGLLVVGVPIFPHGPHLIRKHLVPFFDRLVDRRPRPHVQAFSLRSFLAMWRQSCGDVEIRQRRGFRVISGGILRPLEYCRWWWRLNRKFGRLVPGLCVEVQIVAIKQISPTGRAVDPQASPDGGSLDRAGDPARRAA
ncbi:MAG: methyltransferase domain-containing protein [Planctomycetales bacterium]|nr:methyltransferase domain-containing protein [Planctomycetales bacterium]NIO35143.1 methyltransferase domain-containing protein [Planctomycetales bacterium]NIO47491.1 methyltransferase domain-containing protein [Planctomycetales bacterium]NIP70150.1 methyltransferase domain-containing protein [Planctomycetales bacterium]